MYLKIGNTNDADNLQKLKSKKVKKINEPLGDNIMVFDPFVGSKKINDSK